MKIAIINLITKTPLHRTQAPEVNSNRDALMIKFAKAIQECGHDVDVYISDCFQPKKAEDVGVNVIYLETRFKWLFWPTVFPFTPGLTEKLKDKYDLVICVESFQISTMLAAIARIRSKKSFKLIISQELSRNQKLFFQIPSIIYHHIILKLFLDQHIDAYIPRGNLARTFLLGLGLKESKVRPVVFYGYDEHIFYKDPSVEKKRLIFSPSILRDVKGVDVLIESFAMIRTKLNNLQLIIQGDGPLYEELHVLIQEFRLGDVVQIKRERVSHETMRKLYGSALLTVIASRKESSNLSIIESIACGTPVIMSTGLDNHHNFMNQGGGLIFENENSDQLAELICRVATDKTLQANLEKEALAKAEQYKNAVIARQFLDCI